MKFYFKSDPNFLCVIHSDIKNFQELENLQAKKR